jgi:hypothetical protein
MIKRTLLGAALLSLSASSFAASTNASFERGALTAFQKSAWDSFVTSEAAIFGCEYQDDARLTDELDETLMALSNNEAMDPIMVTYRTLQNMGPNTRKLVTSNIVIASVECNPVYATETELIGVPVIPFEEALTILHDDLANYSDIERVKSLANTFVVAGMDPRWFWSFFVTDKAHMDLLGFDYDTLVQITHALSSNKEPKEYADTSYNLLYDIHRNLHHYPVKFFANSGECEETSSEPSKELMVWPELTDAAIKSFYNVHRIKYKGEWKTKGKIEKGAVSLYQEKPVDNPAVPHFNVSRGLTIYSAECQS